jgi:hypothetical protein
MQTRKYIMAAGAAGLLGLASTASAQTSDALIDKLVEKGILNVKEAQQLRDEADKDFTRALSAKNGMPEYVTAFKLNGDMRARYEGFYKDSANSVDRNRFRYRLRFGGTATLMDDFEVGFLLISQAANGDPISGNQTLQDNGSKKPVAIDLAYGKWNPIHDANWNASLTVGKMKNPFVFSEMVFDGDYTPEGIATELSYNITPDQTVKFIGGGFVLDELGGTSQDPYLLGAQLRWDANWSPKWKSTVGVAFLDILVADRLTVGNIPNNINLGNSRDAAGILTEGYNPIVVDASVTYTMESMPTYAGPFPITVGGEFMHNPRASVQNDAYAAGVTFGKAGKKGLWEFSYRWKELQGDAWYEELVDSDSGAFYAAAAPNSALGAGYNSGTNIRGHMLKASYSPSDSVTLSVALFNMWAINPAPFDTGSTINRLQVDAVWKF